MGEFDATIAAAGYRDTEISQEHASQKNRCGSQLSRDQKERGRTHESRERIRWDGSQLSRDQKERERTHESRERIGWGGSQLSRDQNKKKEHMWAEKEEGGVGPS